MPRSVRWISLLTGCLLALSATGQVCAAELQQYRLGPQDTLKIKVYDLRSQTGEAYQWAAFDGEFVVGAAGHVALPLVGDIDVNDKTTADLEAAIAARLQTKVGLAQKPDASVQVFKYRPFYVLGSVEKPGEYDFRPNLTVLQAVGLAGGLERLAGDALLAQARDALVTRGDLRSLEADRLALTARQARIDAEVNGADKIDFSADLTSRSDQPDIARILREEQLLFDARRHSLTSQLDALQQTKQLLQKEVVSLNAKNASMAHQLEVTQKELDQISGLVSKGLMILPRQLEMERSAAQFASEKLDIEIATLRAQQDISKTDRDSLELKNLRRNEALREGAEVRDKLAQTIEKIDTSRRLLYQSEIRAPAVISSERDALRRPDYEISRRVNGEVQTITAQENDALQPGDVVRIIPRLIPGGAVLGEAAGGSVPQPPESASAEATLKP